MTNLLLSSSASEQMTVKFPNLFGGFEATYSRSFSLFGIDIYWYGILIAVGIVLAYIYAMRRMTRDFGIVKDRAFDVIFAATIGGFLCARIYYCVFRTIDPESPVKYNFVTTFTTIRDGGIAIYGGIIGAVLVGLLFCKIRKVNFFAMADVAALGFLIGQCIGRWGNFINQEAYGDFCPKDWLFGMTGTNISAEVGSSAPVHPCFLYESAWCLLGFLLLHLYSKKLRSYDGEIALLYVAWYGLGRMFIEGLRTDSLYWGKFRVSQLVAIISFAAAVILFAVFKILTKRSGKPLYVNTEASAALIEQDRLETEQRKAKKNKQAPSILADESEKPEDGQPESEQSENEQPESEQAEDKQPEDEQHENSEETLPEGAETDKSESENAPENQSENNPEISEKSAPDNAEENQPEKADENDDENNSQNGLAKPKDE